MIKTTWFLSHPRVEGLERALDVVFRSNRRHVEAVAAGSRGESEFFHSVDEVGTVTLAGRRLNDECLVFKCDESSADTRAKVLKQSKSNLSNAEFDWLHLSLMEYVTTEGSLQPTLTEAECNFLHFSSTGQTASIHCKKSTLSKEIKNIYCFGNFKKSPNGIIFQQHNN